MPSLPHALIGPVLANADAFEASRRYLQRSSSPREYALILGALGLIILFWAALIYWDRIRARFTQRTHDPKSLFLELCHAHGLSSMERSLAWHAANLKGLPQPATVFVDQKILAELAAADGPHAAELGGLRQRLFGGPADGALPPG